MHGKNLYSIKYALKNLLLRSLLKDYLLPKNKSEFSKKLFYIFTIKQTSFKSQ